ncbi:MAG: hypothetical protein Tsb0017_04700 [Geothermobacteraceae bacterium]
MRSLVLLAMLLLVPAAGWSCFGPKLYIAADDSPAQQALYALVTIYIREKTGVESELVSREAGQVGDLIRADRADLEVGTGVVPETAVFRVADQAWLLSGSRPLEDLQFSLVPKALKRLEQRLTGELLEQLIARVAAGEPPLAAARDLLRRQDWI